MDAMAAEARSEVKDRALRGRSAATAELSSLSSLRASAQLHPRDYGSLPHASCGRLRGGAAAQLSGRMHYAARFTRLPSSSSTTEGA